MRKINYLIITILGIVLLGASCTQKDVYSHYVEMKNGKWAQDSLLTFHIDSTQIEANTPYQITLDINNNVNYPYSNIWIWVEHDMQADTILSKQYEYALADEKGTWLGGGTTIFRLSVPMYDNLTLANKKNYTLRVKHAMRDEPLIGIEKIGLRISKR